MEEQSALLQIVYISTARSGLSATELNALLATARAFNASHDVTGLLLYNGKRFLQVLEGDPDTVEALFGRIVRDRRHRLVVRLSGRQIAAREYGGWAMQYVDASGPEARLLAEATRLNDVARAAIGAGIRGYTEFMPA